MIPCSDDVRHVTDESLAPFHRNRRRLPRKQRQHECSSKDNRQLVKRNPLSSSGGTDLRISSLNTFTRNGTHIKVTYERINLAQFHALIRRLWNRLAHKTSVEASCKGQVVASESVDVSRPTTETMETGGKEASIKSLLEVIKLIEQGSDVIRLPDRPGPDAEYSRVTNHRATTLSEWFEISWPSLKLQWSQGTCDRR
ncbi:unnamed protein product [Protopolystoma xenopodis]|uniref:Uncharacterized protein n=1 Tax=Protopolystoma xenopodis TaxID=117903 RepID=A0A3S5C4H5_9PLAT|nr:unnamed protein product [Protopolystoma xenopodis]